MYRTQMQLVKLMTLVSAGGVLGAWLLRCDRAALNFQRGFWWGLGDSISDAIVALT
ncbi:MAG: hypothetical protein IPM18_09600 [Phycisphaerales bacterium]|nr:hypothetical protein [Phycisphaerales bacterium]